MADLSAIERYFHKMNIMKDEMITFLQICSPLIVHLEKAEKEKILNTAWTILFGEESNALNKEETKTASERIRKMWEGIQDKGAREVDASEGHIFDQFK